MNKGITDDDVINSMRIFQEIMHTDVALKLFSISFLKGNNNNISKTKCLFLLMDCHTKLFDFVAT